jgi:AmmeMemoRadiSam system protein A
VGEGGVKDVVSAIVAGLAAGLLGLGCGVAQEGAVPAEGRSKEKPMTITEHRSGAWSPDLTEEERRTLFRIAEDTLRWCVEKPGEPFSFEAYTLTGKLKRDTATFVTLKIDGRLRGCIGSLAPVAPLYRSVHENTVNAAQRDFRFGPVRPGELPAIVIHVSVLSPLSDIAGPDAFNVGEHGIILNKGRHRAVFLPEVALEQNWTREQTLTALSRKAGLEDDAWRRDCTFQVFSSVVLEKEGS